MNSKVSSDKDYVPILKTRKDINQEAIQKINEERSGKQLGLKCRFSKLNIAVGRWFRFPQVISINGLSGHGKSALLNIILADFNNKTLNTEFQQDVIIVHNSFEMLPVDEVLRTVGSKIQKSHLYLLSSEYEVDEVGQGKGYNKVSDAEVEKIEQALSEDEELDHYYFDQPTNVNGIIKNINASIIYYQQKNNTDAIPKIVVALDHTLLVNQDKGDNVLDTVTRISKLSIALKKKGYMVVLVGQLNNEIEKTERIKNSDLHFPIKSDIYAQAQIYNACDIVLVIHQPELLGILKYGKNQLDARLLVHLQVLKQRFGKVGSIWLKNELNKGRLIEFVPESYGDKNKVK